jgi:tRNA-specific 2-thiouridylase
VNHNKTKTIFVGMSGGVDSSTSAALLKEAGFNVVGVFIKVWHPDFLPCNWQAERVDAMRVCARLSIPFMTVDLADAYKKGVADYLISEYKAGRTPNPDVMCNKNIKFGSFLAWAREQGADGIATGHYAQTRERDGGVELVRSADDEKDQTYFLWTLTQEEMKRVQFPVGGYTKPEVRKLAEKFNLPVAEKKDSQGICFLGAIDLRSFLKHFIDVTPGPVKNIEGEVVGEHEGALLYTIGQRHGFIISEKTTAREPYFVVAKDIATNTITVSHNPQEPSFTHTDMGLSDINWISGKTPELGKKYTARYRHQGKLHSCTLADGGKRVHFDEPQHGLAQGQSVVVYDSDVCLGGGVIS